MPKSRKNSPERKLIAMITGVRMIMIAYKNGA